MTEPRTVDLDLTPLLPQTWQIRVGDRTFSINSDQPPELIWRAAAAAHEMQAALTSGEDTAPLIENLARVTAEILGISAEEARGLGWMACMRLFGFLAKPVTDLALMMRLSMQLAPSPSPSAEG